MLNLALRKPALQSSFSRYSIGHTVADDAKGGNNGHLSGQYGFHTKTERDPWWQVDLEDSFQVHRVVIFNRADQAERLKHFSVLGSSDGKEWKVLFRKTDDHVFGRDGEPYTAEIADQPLVRFVRVRLDGQAPLHFRECQVFGVHPDPKVRAEMEQAKAEAEERRNSVPPGRQGRIVEIGGFAIFVDDENNYDRSIIAALERGDYDCTERQLVGQLVTHGDRVIDVGTAIGVVAMTAASAAGGESVLTLDANFDITNDAQDNFKRNGLEAIRCQVGILRNRQAINHPQQAKAYYIDKAFWASHPNAPATDHDARKTAQVPILCLEDIIDNHRATVLTCDLGGGEVELLRHADLSCIRLIILKTHYCPAGEAAIDDMVGQLILSGFSLHLDMSHHGVLVLCRHRT
jgi:FkbM family methyltransferase